MSPSAQSIAAQAKHRKQAMAGSGESWILPRKWRDIQAGEGDVTLNGETLPVCKRVMLFKFGNSHGFSSEMLHYLRAGVIAQKLGYTLLGDDSGWNYGALRFFCVFSFLRADNTLRRLDHRLLPPSRDLLSTTC